MKVVLEGITNNSIEFIGTRMYRELTNRAFNLIRNDCIKDKNRKAGIFYRKQDYYFYYATYDPGKDVLYLEFTEEKIPESIRGNINKVQEKEAIRAFLARKSLVMMIDDTLKDE